jgi:hypothetical protein
MYIADEVVVTWSTSRRVVKLHCVQELSRMVGREEKTRLRDLCFVLEHEHPTTLVVDVGDFYISGTFFSKYIEINSTTH